MDRELLVAAYARRLTTDTAKLFVDFFVGPYDDKEILLALLNLREKGLISGNQMFKLTLLGRQLCNSYFV